jgi:ribosome maturation factor RimP
MLNKEQIEKLVNEFITGTDQFLVDIKLSPSRLAVFIDKPQGISLDECAALSRHLVTTLDGSGFLESHELEVSSPGMDMPLRVPGQYKRRIGQELSVFLREGSNFKGFLQSAGNEDFEINVVSERKENKKKIKTEELKKYRYDDVRESKLIFNFKNK